MPVDKGTEQPEFEYLSLRLLVSILAFALPLLVLFFSPPTIRSLSSISVSYHTTSRDIFVGSLFVIAALLVAYRGHYPNENRIANLGALAAVVAALCPTACDLPGNFCQNINVAQPISISHLLAGATLFSVIAYFCLGPFTTAAQKKTSTKAKRRLKVYRVCGWIIVGCIAVAAAAQIPQAEEFKNAVRLIFFTEWVALWAFGFAWIVASRFLPWFADKNEQLIVSF
jgi:hypothetical protein